MSALMSQWDVAKKTLNTALNESDGSAERELESWNQGIDASIAHFQASFQEFSTTILNSDFVKGFVDAGTKVLDVITSIIDKVGVLQTALLGIGGFKLFKNLDLFYSELVTSYTRKQRKWCCGKCVLLRFKKESVTAKVIEYCVL